MSSNVSQINFKTAKPSSSVIYEFDDFRFDAGHLMLYRNGAEVALTPKQAETLLAFIENSGEIVSKEFLMSRLWGDTVVEWANVTQNIYVLRRILGNTSGNRPIIETLRGRGYRFNADLKINGSNQRDGTRGLELAEAYIGKRRKVMALGAVGVLAAAAAIGYVVYSARPSAAKAKTLAVLPLKPIDPANRSDLYEIGVVDALINTLNSTSGLVARPLSAIRKYTEIDQDPYAAGREQQVDYVLASNYQLADGKFRLTSQLINVATGGIEEPYKLEKEITTVFAVQDAVAEDLAARLTTRFGASGGKSTKQRGTTNEDAYRLYLQARYLLDRRNQRDVPKAIQLLEKAVELDANYAIGWAALAVAHSDQAHTEGADPERDHTNSMTALEKALAIDPNISEIHAAFCVNKYYYERDFIGAERECRRAIELDANSSVAHTTYARFLDTRNRMDEALAEGKTAIGLEPASYWNHRVYANSLYFARRYDEAIEEYRRLLDLNENAGPTYQWLVRTFEAKGDEAQAFEWFIRSLALNNADEGAVERYRTLYRESGWNGVLKEREKSGGPGVSNFFRLAGLNARLGEKDKAFAYLEQSFQRREYLLSMVQVEPQLDSIRDDARYADLIKRIEGS